MANSRTTRSTLGPKRRYKINAGTNGFHDGGVYCTRIAQTVVRLIWLITVNNGDLCVVLFRAYLCLECYFLMRPSTGRISSQLSDVTS